MQIIALRGVHKNQQPGTAKAVTICGKAPLKDLVTIHVLNNEAEHIHVEIK